MSEFLKLFQMAFSSPPFLFDMVYFLNHLHGLKSGVAASPCVLVWAPGSDPGVLAVRSLRGTFVLSKDRPRISQEKIHIVTLEFPFLTVAWQPNRISLMEGVPTREQLYEKRQGHL